MSTVSSDYVNYSGGGACNYGNLQNYNATYEMGVPFQGKVTKGVMIVPGWNAIGYDSLTSKVPSCSGYNDINSAYGADAGNCQTTYTTSLCGNGSAPAPLGKDCGSLPPGKAQCSCCMQDANRQSQVCQRLLTSGTCAKKEPYMRRY